MKASERLLKLEWRRLEVWNFIDSEDVGVSYQDCEVKEGYALVGIFGRGKNFEEACEDYLRQITGKTLVFSASTKSRKEVSVL